MFDKRLNLKTPFISLICVVFWPIFSANAHPHILINAKVNFHLSQTQNQTYQLDKLSYVWHFDENFSLLLLGDYDDDQNQLLDLDELSTMGIETMDGAKELAYFTHLFNGEAEILALDAPQVRATFADNRLSLTFDLTLPQSVPISNEFKFTLFDEEYYTAFIFNQKSDYQLIGDNLNGCALQTKQQAQTDDNMETALANAFNQDTINQGMGSQFADKIGIICG